MSTARDYNVFISHAWEESEDYRRIVRMLNQARLFSWVNQSVTRKGYTQSNSPGEIIDMLMKQIEPAEIVVVVSDIYWEHSKDIQQQINLAQQLEKPIIGIKSLGKEGVPPILHYSAAEVVDWAPMDIVSAIRNNSLMPQKKKGSRSFTA